MIELNIFLMTLIIGLSVYSYKSHKKFMKKLNRYERMVNDAFESKEKLDNNWKYTA